MTVVYLFPDTFVLGPLLGARENADVASELRLAHSELRVHYLLGASWHPFWSG